MQRTMKILNKLKPRRKNIENDFFVFDCETNGLNARPENFIFCCLYGKDYCKFFFSIDDFKNEIFSGGFRKKYIFCHNSHFDLPVVFGNVFLNLDVGAVFNGSRFIIAEKDGVIFGDSFNILTTSVEQIGKELGMYKKNLSDKFKEGTHRGSAFVTDDEKEYCKQDCVIVWEALKEIFLTVGSIRPTIAGMSLLFYRRKYQPYHIAYNDLVYSFFDSYYGGRVECFKLGKTNSQKYDINSMYPYVMNTGFFPHVNTLRECATLTVEMLLHLLKYKEGFTDLTIEHKYNKFGFLPVKKGGKLIFPIGVYRGSWCFPEIRLALEHGVIKIIDVHRIVYGTRIVSPFKTFASELYEMRKNEKGYKKTVYKYLLNNLYGKFAQRKKEKCFYLPYFDIDLDQLLKKMGFTYEWKGFSAERGDYYLTMDCRTPIEIKHDINTGLYTFKTVNKEKTKERAEKMQIHCIPAFSAYITSLARVHLLRHIIKFEKYNITYCDTDSVAVEKKMKIANSDLLGEFKKESNIITEILGNKMYLEFDGDKIKEKIKGIPKNSIKLANGKYELKKIIKLKQAIRQNKNVGELETVTKQLSFNYDKRKVFSNGETEPLRL